MTAKEALIKSIYKYNHYIAKKKLQGFYSGCSLCDFEHNDLLGCSGCPMYNYWPQNSGLSKRCDDLKTAWDLWDDFKFCNPYDAEFFARILVDAFHERLQELYK